MEYLKTIWRWIGRNKVQLEIVAVIIGAAWAMWPYFEGIQVAREHESRQYLERFNGTDIAASYNILNAYWLTDEGLTLLDHTKPVDWPAIAREHIKREHLEADFNNMLQFYLELSSCSNSRTCDPEMLCKSFGQEITNFRHFYSAYLSEISTIHGRDLSELYSFVGYCRELKKKAK